MKSDLSHQHSVCEVWLDLWLSTYLIWHMWYNTALSSRRWRQRERLSASVLSICSFVCLSPIHVFDSDLVIVCQVVRAASYDPTNSVTALKDNGKSTTSRANPTRLNWKVKRTSAKKSSKYTVCL